MPRPDYLAAGEDPFDLPNLGLEIIGKGSDHRASKTYIRDMPLVVVLGLIRGHAELLAKLFRRLHARHHKVKILHQDEHGRETVEWVPQVLDDVELRRAYPIIAQWERQHQEWVDHAASLEGFSISAASGLPDAPRRREADSSAGSDQEEGPARTRWK